MGVSSKCYDQYAVHQQINALQQWKINTDNRAIWKRLKNKFVPVLTYWYRRVVPNPRFYLHRWRMNILLMRKGVEANNHSHSDPSARLNPSLTLSLMDAENMSHQASVMYAALTKLSINQRYGGYTGDSNDGLSQLQNATWVIANYLGKLSKKSVSVDITARGNKKDIQVNKDKIEKVHTDITNIIKSRFDVAEKALASYK